jgi:tight adherence protein B
LDGLSAVVFGSAVGGAVALAAAAIAAGRRERVLAALGGARRSSGIRGRIPEAGRLAARARRDGWRHGAPSYAMLLSAAGAVGAAVGFRLLGVVGGLAGLATAPLGIRALLRRNVARTAELLEEQFRDAVVALAAAVRAGLSVRRALEEVTRESDQPLRGFLEGAIARLGVGEPLESALASLADQLGQADAAMLVSLVAIHRRSGGDLATMLDELGRLVGLRRGARRDMRTLTAQARASGAVLAVLPIAFVTLLSWTGGDGLGDFYRTPTGSGLLIGGLTCEILGFLWIRRIVRPRGIG